MTEIKKFINTTEYEAFPLTEDDDAINTALGWIRLRDPEATFERVKDLAAQGDVVILRMPNHPEQFTFVHSTDFAADFEEVEGEDIVDVAKVEQEFQAEQDAEAQKLTATLSDEEVIRELFEGKKKDD